MRFNFVRRLLTGFSWLLLMPFASSAIGATPWTPASPGAPVMRLWLDAADSSTLTTTGTSPTLVTQWNDKSGKGNNAVAPSGYPKPTLTTLNSHGALDFGTYSVCVNCYNEPFMQLTSEVSTAQTVFIIWGSTNGGGFMLADTGSYGWHRGASGYGANANDYIFSNVYASSYLFSGDSITNLNGAAVDPTNTGLSGAWDLVSVRSSTANPVPFNSLAQDRGYRTGGLGIAELIAIDARADTATVQRIEGYLAWKWGLQAKLPRDHPYSAWPPGLGPMAQYHLDESSYSGATGEVIDSSGNGLNGTAIGSALPVPSTASPAIAGAPGTCGNALFVQQQSAMTISGLPVQTATGAQTSVAFWMYWDGTDNEMPIGWNQYNLYLSNGLLRFNDAQGLGYMSSSGLANSWHHVVAVFTNGDYASNHLYIDGVDQVLTQPPGWGNTDDYVSSTLYISGWGYNGGYRFTGRLDEVQVFDGALTPSEVSALYTQTHACSSVALPAASLVAEYRFEESSWNGSAGEVKDSSGGHYNGAAAGSPLPTLASALPAKAGTPGSCSYASLPGPSGGGGYINVSGLPVSTAAGAQTSVAFWMYWTGNNDAMPVGWYGYDLWFSGGYFGFNSFASDVYGVSSAGLANGWHHITAIFVNGNAAASVLYIDGIRQGLTFYQSFPSNANAYVGSTFHVGAAGQDNGHRFSGYLDEVKVYNNALTAAQVTAVMAMTHPCNGTADPVGAFNAFETSTVSGAVIGVIHTKVAASSFFADVVATDASRSLVDTTFTGSVKVELLDASDNTASIDATGCRSSWSAIVGNAGAMLTFVSGDAGRKTVSLSEPNAWRDVRVRMTTPATGTATAVACSTDDFAIRPSSFGGLTASDASSTTIGTARTLANVSASGGNVHKAGQPFTIAARAINAASATTTNYAGTPTTALSACSGTACVSTGAWTNIASESGTFSFSGTYPVRYGAGSTYLIASFSNPSAVVCTTTNFGGDPLPNVYKHCDVGSGGTLSITSDSSSASSPIWTVIAGEGGAFSFAGTQTVRYGMGSSYYAASFTNPSGIVCTTTNFGGDPAPGVVKTCSVQWSVTPAASAGVLNLGATYSEVGSFALQLLDTTFAGVDAADGSSAAEMTIASPIINVGRFVPDHFDVTSLAAPTLRTFDSSTCSSRSFTYIGQAFGYASTAQATVLARNAGGVTTTLYANALWKLTSASITQGYTATPSTPTLITTGTTAPAMTPNNNGTGLLVSAVGDKLNFFRSSAAPVNPFNASIALSWDATDSSEAGVTGNGNITTPTPLIFSNITFDATNAMRYGLLKLTPAYGSEMVNLPVPIEAQYWDGVRWATNAADQCTSVPVNAVTMGNYQRSLSACKTALGSGNVTLNSGRGYLKLVKPGSGSSGSVDLTMQLGASASGQTCSSIGSGPITTSAGGLSWLQGRWGGATTFDQNPSTRASFGQYRSPLIYQREIY